MNEDVVRQLVRIIDSARRKRFESAGKQVFVSMHSYALLSNPGIDAKGIAVVVPSDEGSIIRKVNEAELIAIMSGFLPLKLCSRTCAACQSGSRSSLIHD